MALGLSYGLHRLTIMQKWSPRNSNKALLPSDRDGVVTIRFEGSIEGKFPELETRLKMLGVDFA